MKKKIIIILAILVILLLITGGIVLFLNREYPDDEDTSYSNIDLNGYKLYVGGKELTK